MSNSITISGATPAEFIANFTSIAARFGFLPREAVAKAVHDALVKIGKGSQNVQPEVVAPAAEMVEVATSAIETPQALAIGSAASLPAQEPEILPPDKPKRAGKKTAAAPAEPQPKAVERPLDVDDVRLAMRDLASKFDVSAPRALLDHFKVNKASEVPADKIAEFVRLAAEFPGAAFAQVDSGDKKAGKQWTVKQ